MNSFIPTNEKAINFLCKDCMHKCKQSKEIDIIECPQFEEKHDEPIVNKTEKIFILILKDGEVIPDKIYKYIMAHSKPFS